MCNRFVDFLLKIDKAHIYRFSPLQGELASRLLPSELIAPMNSVVVYKEGQRFQKSEAVIQVMKDIGGFWGLLAKTIILPTALNDKLYDLVAENRYAIFGKRETCRVPTEEERQYFV